MPLGVSSGALVTAGGTRAVGVGAAGTDRAGRDSASGQRVRTRRRLHGGLGRVHAVGTGGTGGTGVTDSVSSTAVGARRTCHNGRGVGAGRAGRTDSAGDCTTGGVPARAASRRRGSCGGTLEALGALVAQVVALQRVRAGCAGHRSRRHVRTLVPSRAPSAGGLGLGCLIGAGRASSARIGTRRGARARGANHRTGARGTLEVDWTGVAAFKGSVVGKSCPRDRQCTTWHHQRSIVPCCTQREGSAHWSRSGQQDRGGAARLPRPCHRAQEEYTITGWGAWRERDGPR